MGLACASFAVAALLGELFLRYVWPVEFMRPETIDASARSGWYGMIHRRSSVPGVAYELVPGLDQDSVGAHVRTNSLGMRDDEPLPRDTPGLFRVLALGDSVTFGFRVSQSENFSAFLEGECKPLALAARPVEVLNAGVSGYASRDEAAVLAGRWIELEPDLIVLSYVLNDPEFEARQPLPRFFVEPHAWQHSALLRWVMHKREAWRIRELGQGSYFRYLHAPGEPAWQSVDDAFTRIAEVAKAHDIRVVMPIFPLFSPRPWNKYPFRAQHAQVAAAGAAKGFLVIDLLERFEREDPRSLLIADDDSHPNAAGHRIAAEEIRRCIDEHWERIERR